MSIDALLNGKIYGQPEERTSRNGNPFVVARLRVPMANGESMFAGLVAFRDSARAALLALGDSDAATVAGELKLGSYLDKAGLPKASLDVTVHQVLTPYAVQRKRAAVSPPESKPTRDDAPAPAAAEPELDDALPF